MAENIGLSAFNSKYYNNPYEVNNQTNVSLNPSLARFTKTNQLFGIGLMYNYNHQKSTIVNYANNTDTTTNYSHAIGVNLFCQRFITLAHNFYFTITTAGSAAYNFGKTSDFSVGKKLPGEPPAIASMQALPRVLVIASHKGFFLMLT